MVFSSNVRQIIRLTTIQTKTKKYMPQISFGFFRLKFNTDSVYLHVNVAPFDSMKRTLSSVRNIMHSVTVIITLLSVILWEIARTCYNCLNIMLNAFLTFIEIVRWNVKNIRNMDILYSSPLNKWIPPIMELKNSIYWTR